MTRCPDCDAFIPPWPAMYVGQPIECPECGAALEVISLDPFAVGYCQGEEDWADMEEG